MPIRLRSRRPLPVRRRLVAEARLVKSRRTAPSAAAGCGHDTTGRNRETRPPPGVLRLYVERNLFRCPFRSGRTELNSVLVTVGQHGVRGEAEGVSDSEIGFRILRLGVRALVPRPCPGEGQGVRAYPSPLLQHPLHLCTMLLDLLRALKHRRTAKSPPAAATAASPAAVRPPAQNVAELGRIVQLFARIAQTEMRVRIARVQPDRRTVLFGRLLEASPCRARDFPTPRETRRHGAATRPTSKSCRASASRPCSPRRAAKPGRGVTMPRLNLKCAAKAGLRRFGLALCRLRPCPNWPRHRHIADAVRRPAETRPGPPRDGRARTTRPHSYCGRRPCRAPARRPGRSVPGPLHAVPAAGESRPRDAKSRRESPPLQGFAGKPSPPPPTAHSGEVGEPRQTGICLELAGRASLLR